MFVLKGMLLSALCALAYSQNYGPTTTPVPILKQINRQNDDGSYSYGYEAADGSFKIETKYPSGDVAGKYGYVDESGKVREVSYGASSQRGFEPEGTGIMVPPPTLHDPSTNALTDGQEDDGQYREDPRIYEDPKYNGRAQARPSAVRQYKQPVQPQASFQSSFQSQPQPTYQQQQYQSQQYQPQPQYQQPQPQYQQQQYQPQQPSYTQQSSLFSQSPQQFPQERPQSQVYHQQPQFSYQAYTPQPYQNQNYQSQNYQTQNYNPFNGHPAQNFDPNTGSYSINFTG
ncbi:activating signal cointegrator 1 complex subunit 2 homolog [Vanessa atalanta]|uniref:activating signal cointegrator 1 complex subunit 2 homolog n=1 Tax=Vanessa atalanta TaxID=42275 RepID=UPI001FCD0984|nr:activating signal cointegrator 1 complex subunit 2 homolog [Vanessa atalanta]